MNKIFKMIIWLFFSIIFITCICLGYWHWYLLGYRNDQEIHLLPNNFQGVVFILFNLPNGTPPEYESGKRVYRIPKNGVLRTQFKAQTGVLRAPEYYYLTFNGHLLPISYKLPHEQRMLSKVFVSTVETGSGGCQPGTEGHYTSLAYRSYIVTDKRHEDFYYAESNDENKSPHELICDLNGHSAAH